MTTTTNKKGVMYEAHAVGKRKCSIARIYLAEGTGKITVNHREFQEYFKGGSGQYVCKQPLNLLNLTEKYDIVINVCGGGITGQAGAVRLGISRALLKLDENYRSELRKAGFLTRDSRIVERKKYGLSGARKAYQFSKR
jgi:small subunit ribosomal protein S9